MTFFFKKKPLCSPHTCCVRRRSLPTRSAPKVRLAKVPEALSPSLSPPPPPPPRPFCRRRMSPKTHLPHLPLRQAGWLQRCTPHHPPCKRVGGGVFEDALFPPPTPPHPPARQLGIVKDALLLQSTHPPTHPNLPQIRWAYPHFQDLCCKQWPMNPKKNTHIHTFISPRSCNWQMI